MRIRVHIERLVLEGLPVSSHDGARVRAAVTAELERLIGAHGIANEFRAAGVAPAIRAGAMQIGVASSPRRLGVEIARAAHGGLKPE